jgi:hypothetical protein
VAPPNARHSTPDSISVPDTVLPPAQPGDCLWRSYVHVSNKVSVRLLYQVPCCRASIHAWSMETSDLMLVSSRYTAVMISISRATCKIGSLRHTDSAHIFPPSSLLIHRQALNHRPEVQKICLADPPRRVVVLRSGTICQQPRVFSRGCRAVFGHRRDKLLSCRSIEPPAVGAFLIPVSP